VPSRQEAALTREEQRSLWLHRAVANKIACEADRVLAIALRNLHVLREQHPVGVVRAHFDEWESLLDGPLDALLTTLVSTSPRAVELRQDSPFAGALDADERTEALIGFRRSFAAQTR